MQRFKQFTKKLRPFFDFSIKKESYETNSGFRYLLPTPAMEADMLKVGNIDGSWQETFQLK